MTTLFLIMILIIILSILYLYYRNIQYNLILENFDNTQSSLSTYYSPDTIDLKSGDIINIFKMLGVNIFSNIKNAGWNGIWRNDGLTLNGQFIQNNDKLIMSFSNVLFDTVYTSSNFDQFNNDYKCPNNLFLGIGQLNKKRTKFILTKILCNKYTNSSLNLSVNNFSGYLNYDKIILSSNNIPNNVILKKSKNLSFNSNDLNIKNKYIDANSKYINSLPVIPDSELDYSEKLCPNNTQPCMDIQDGISLTSYSNLNYNACGNPDSNNICTGTPQCVFYENSLNGIPSCSKTKKTYDYMNYAAFTNLSQTTGNSLNICYDYLKYFPDKCNSCVLCYITDLGNVLTLSYEYFGTLQGQNNLTVQSDIMNDYLNDSSLDIGFLPNYRNIITKNDTTNIQNAINALSFTNILENNNEVNNSKTRIQNSVIQCQNYVNKYKPSITNKNYAPFIWQINFNNGKTHYNLLNSCEITISTSQNYNYPVKYVKYDNNGNMNLSTFKGGDNEQFILENATIINKNDGFMQPSVAITANIKGNNGLYLVPSNNINGFSNNSNIINMVPKEENNGKWLILGFNLNNIEDSTKDIRSIVFDKNII